MTTEAPAAPIPPHGVLATTPIPKPATFLKLAGELVTRSDISMQKLTEIIEMDVTLRAEVICQANAWVYSLGRPVKDLKQAVACLGFDRCRCLILARLRIGAAAAEPASPVVEKKESTASSSQTIAGVRPYRKERLSSLYPPKKGVVRPHFLPGWFKQT